MIIYLKVLKCFFIVDMFFTGLHWIIDSFEYADYWSEIRNSLKHHNQPHLRGNDTYTSILNMTIKSTLVILLFYDFFSFLLGYKIYLSAFDIIIYFIFVLTAFLNHKYVHSPSNKVPAPFKFLQEMLLVDKKYHRIHHSSEIKPKNFSFLFGLIDRPCSYLFNASYKKVFWQMVGNNKTKYHIAHYIWNTMVEYLFR
ncbi:TPA: fatty acid desaturase CarF family protein [Legionella anisa]